MKTSIFLAITFSLVFLPSFVMAQNLQNQVMEQVNVGAGTAKLDKVEPQTVIARVIEFVLSTVGIVFIALLVYGGFIFITAQGEEEKIKKAIYIIKPAIIGLIVILIAYSITYFVGLKFGQAVTEGVEVSK